MSEDERTMGLPPEGCEGNAAPYVLGALTEDEHQAFRLHLLVGASIERAFDAINSSFHDIASGSIPATVTASPVRSARPTT